MDFLKKENTMDTASQGFSQRSPFGQKNSQNLPYVSQIQELMAMLIQRKSELKEAKLKQANLLAKQEQQEVRISKIKIAMEHQIEKEQMMRSNQEKMEDEVVACKDAIMDLTKVVKTTKSELAEILEEIIISKKNKNNLQASCSALQTAVSAKSAENMALDTQTQNLDTMLISSQNDARCKNDELINLSMQRTQLQTLIGYLQQKLKVATKSKNCLYHQNCELSQQIIKAEQKIQNIKRESNQIDWSCEQIRSQNSQIWELNTRLEADLEAVKKHLVTMQKMNKVLEESLQAYGVTGDKVTRMIHAAKNQ